VRVRIGAGALFFRFLVPGSIPGIEQTGIKLPYDSGRGGRHERQGLGKEVVSGEGSNLPRRHGSRGLKGLEVLRGGRETEENSNSWGLLELGEGGSVTSKRGAGGIGKNSILRLS